jgi:16S rRNA (guanine966-N2)-methyltransferase
VREALFSILAADVRGARVLDLYAGSGALGIEALSRGAVHATFVERSRSAAVVVRGNLEALGLGERTRVVVSDVERAASTLEGDRAFDLVFADPPYAEVAKGGVARAIDALASKGVLGSPALVVIEHASRDDPPVLASAALRETRRYGDTSVSIYLAAVRATE